VRVLVLDDDDKRHESFKFHLFRHEATHVHTAQEAMEALASNGPWDVVFLDHDLNYEHYVSSTTGKLDGLEQTGYDVAKYIALFMKEETIPKNVVVHSWNSYGADRMIQMLSSTPAIKCVRRWMFDPGENPMRLLGFD
jgi:CheY-like chemotaxis protein